jgi:hypothetical protein
MITNRFITIVVIFGFYKQKNDKGVVIRGHKSFLKYSRLVINKLEITYMSFGKAALYGYVNYDSSKTINISGFKGVVGAKC